MRRVILALALVATACGVASGGDEDSDPTLTTTSKITTSTTSAATTTTARPEACVDTLKVGRPTVLEPGCLYSPEPVDGTFLLDLNVTMEGSGWIETVNQSRVVRFSGPAFDRLVPQVDIIIMPSDEMLEALTVRLSAETRSNSDVTATAAIPVRVGGHSGVTLDVYHPYDPTDEDVCGETFEAGMILLQVGIPPVYGPRLCSWTRVWILEVDDLVVVILGGDTRTGRTRRLAAEAASLPDTRPILETAWNELVSGITFCTDEDPCDS